VKNWLEGLNFSSVGAQLKLCKLYVYRPQNIIGQCVRGVEKTVGGSTPNPRQFKHWFLQFRKLRVNIIFLLFVGLIARLSPLEVGDAKCCFPFFLKK